MSRRRPPFVRQDPKEQYRRLLAVRDCLLRARCDLDVLETTKARGRIGEATTALEAEMDRLFPRSEDSDGG